MSYLGSWKIDDLLTFYANTTRFDTGNATDADAVPSYRVYEDETATPILTGTMALLDSANTAGFYSEQITLSAANGFEKGKSYAIYIAATVNSIAGTTHHTLQIEAEVDANIVSDKTGYSLAAGAITAAVIATDAIDNDAIAANAVTEIQNGLATAVSLAVVASYIDTEITTLQADVAAILDDTGTSGVVVATGSKTGYALTAGERNSIADAWIARVIEGAHTLGDFMRLFASVLTGKSAGGGGVTITFRDLADSKNRISATVDANGNRTAVGTRDGT